MRRLSRRLLQDALEEYTDEQAGRPRRGMIGKHCYTYAPAMLPSELANAFVQLDFDDESKGFVERSRCVAHNFCLQLFYSFVNLILSWFMSRTDINGLLNRGQMFIFSKAHLRKLFDQANVGQFSPIFSSMLDIGAGDGCVTHQFRDVSDSIYVTEASTFMQRVLARKKFHVLATVDSWKERTYDLITLLNVLDRCDKPATLLRESYQQLRSGGLLVIAIVLPYAPFVEHGSRKFNPSERLNISGQSWEAGVTTLWNNVVAPIGYHLVALTRLPYLSEGDIAKDYYMIHDAILILRKP